MAGTKDQQNTQDQPVEEPVHYTDQEIATLYQKGHISRAEADVYELIADFNDGPQGGIASLTK